jgi:glycosyltransferase involved in cell wall biosynthesis
MKALFIALGDRRMASSRIRAWDLCSSVSRVGWHTACVVGPSRRGMTKLLLAGKQDVIVIQKWTPPRLVLSLARQKADVLIYDCDDAIYLALTGQSPLAKRNRERLLASWSFFDGLSTSTDLIAEDLRKLAPGLPTLTFPGPRPELQPFSRQRSGVVWLGSPATEVYLYPILAQLKRINDAYGFIALGASIRSSELGLKVTGWDEQVQREILGSAAVGLFVQSAGEWETRKSGYKLLEYLASGVIPVAQDNDASRKLLGDDYPFLVKDSSWESAVNGVFELSFGHRQQLMLELQRRSEQFSFANISQAWVRFTTDAISSVHRTDS